MKNICSRYLLSEKDEILNKYFIFFRHKLMLENSIFPYSCKLGASNGNHAIWKSIRRKVYNIR